MNLNEPINAHRVGQAVGNYRWTICAMLFFATTVNYLDRQVLSLLAPQLSTQFGWSNTDYANIAAVFQFVYAISMLFAGRFVDKIGTKAAYVMAIAIWSTGAIMHAFAVPMGEGIAAVSAAIGLAVIPVSIAGFMLSRAVLAICVPLIAGMWGWEAAFMVIGMLRRRQVSEKDAANRPCEQ
uniref:MFS transporter n=1 Tax=Pseudomonas sp. TaxID=306 RepID=UPI003FD7A712